ncbi:MULTISPECIES: hypothetical protein [unclassified Nonomuraea]|uniref:hypothetical protein n=1 Tax=unclassified Nonomuraea TaxID=2593643 RepID=UPI0033D6A578
MPYKTFTAGEILTAADVMTYLMNQVVVVCTSGTRPSSPAEGRVIYETDTDRMMIWDGTAWAEALINSTSRPCCGVTRATDQAVGTGTTGILVSWSTENYDVGNMTTGSGTTLATIPANRGGKYLISAAIAFTANGTGTRTVLVNVSGNTRVRQSAAAAGSGNPTRVSVSTIQTCASGDTITIGVFQDSGASLNVLATEGMPHGAVYYLGP